MLIQWSTKDKGKDELIDVLVLDCYTHGVDGKAFLASKVSTRDTSDEVDQN